MYIQYSKIPRSKSVNRVCNGAVDWGEMFVTESALGIIVPRLAMYIYVSTSSLSLLLSSSLPFIISISGVFLSACCIDKANALEGAQLFDGPAVFPVVGTDPPKT